MSVWWFPLCFVGWSNGHLRDPPCTLQRGCHTWWLSYGLFDRKLCSRSSGSTFLNRPKNVRLIKAVFEGLIKKREKQNLCSRSSVSTEKRSIKKVTVKFGKVSVRLCQNMVQKLRVFTFRRKEVLAFANSGHNFLICLERRHYLAGGCWNCLLGACEETSKCPFIFLDNYEQFEIFEMRYKFSIKTALLTDTSKTRGFFLIKKPLYQVSGSEPSSLSGKMLLPFQRGL